MGHRLNQRILNNQMTRRDFLWMMGVASAGTALSGCSIDPVTGGKTLTLLSTQDEIAIDRQQSPHQFSSDYGVSQDESLNSYLSDTGILMGRQSHRPDMPYNFQVVNANYINAYAFPGGTIACTRGIMLDMESEDELCALLGHELGHVNARHAAKQQSKGMIAQAVATGAGLLASTQDAWVGSAVGLASQLASGALLSHYSRENERQADDLGIDYMTRTQHNPQGMIELMNMLNSQSDRQPNMLELMFATHPMSSERVKNVTATAQSDKYQAFTRKPLQKERYMDNTAALRRLAPAIKLQQQGESQLMGKSYDAAQQSFKQALGKAPDDYTGLVLMAKTYIAQEKPANAQPYLDKASSVYPQQAQAQQLSGINSLALKQPAKAYQAFTRSDKLLPGNPTNQFFMGVAQENMQDKAAAAEHYRSYLNQVSQGDMASHAYTQLKGWGYL